MKPLKTRTWVLLLAAVALVLGGLALYQALAAPPARYAVILVDGREVRRVDLSVEQTFTVEAVGGSNEIEVAAGKIRVKRADCDGNDCVHTGAKNSGAPIICLPHRLVIRFSDSGGIDGQAG